MLDADFLGLLALFPWLLLLNILDGFFSAAGFSVSFFFLFFPLFLVVFFSLSKLLFSEATLWGMEYTSISFSIG